MSDDLFGVGPAPLPPQLPQPPTPSAHQPNQKALSLAAIAAMLTGGRSAAGFGQGILAHQQQQDQQNHQQAQLDLQRYQVEDQNYRLQQQQYQQQMQAKQKLLMDAVGAIKQGVDQGHFKSEGDYNLAVEQTAALLQNGYGMRINGNFLRSAAGYYPPDETKTIYDTLDKAFKNPLSGSQFSPEDTINFKGSDGSTKRITIGQAVEKAGYPVALSPEGTFKKVGTKPMTAEDAAKKPGELEMIRARLKATGYADGPKLDEKVFSEWDAMDRKRKAAIKEDELRLQRQYDKPSAAAGKDPGLTDLERQLKELQVQKAAEDLKTAKARNEPQQTSQAAVERTQLTLATIDKLMPKISNWTVGPGSLIAGVPTSKARDFASALTTLKANITLNELAAMKSASKNGASGFGQLSDREGKMLESALGGLDTGQSPEAFTDQMKQIRAIVQRWKDAALQEGQAPAVSPVPSHETGSTTPVRTYGKYTFTVEP